MMDRRFVDSVPWYVNGTLQGEDRAWVEEQADGDPEMARELRWYRSLRADLRDTAADVAEDIGLERALKKIRTESARAGGAVRDAAGGGFLARLRERLATLGMTPAFAVAAVLVVVQAGVIVHMARVAEDNAAAIRAAGGVEVVEAPLLRIAFKPDAREADIRMLLVDIKGEVVGGPGQLGSYYVRVTGNPQEVLARVRASSIVDQAVVVPGIPPKVE